MSSSVRAIPNVRIPMRDGVRLAADIYVPAGGQPAPALLHRTPYGKQTPLWVRFARHFAEAGFAVVIQDVRGRWESEGEWYPQFVEGKDGFDTIEWVARQPWCDGAVGMYGASYAGWAQWAAAREHPPSLRALASTAAAGRWFEEVQYRHGVLTLQTLQWLHMVSGRTTQDNSLIDWSSVLEHLPLRTIDREINLDSRVWQEWLDHDRLDWYWRALRLDDDFASIDLPALHITGWFDGDQPGALFFYRGMTERSPARDRQRLVIGPWDHAGTRVPHANYGPLDFGSAALVDILDLHVQWFDQHLRGRVATPDAGVRYFVMGANEWLTDPRWPPTRSERLVLHFAEENGRRTLAEEAGSDAVHAYRYDPADPVRMPPHVERQYQFGKFFESRDDQDVERSAVERRPDVLVYESSPLSEALTLAGPSLVELYAESDAVDTDWIVWLADHWPDGRSIMLAHGELGARYRDSLEDPKFLEPGRVYRFPIELTEVAYTVPRGHRLAMIVTSSSFPRFARNPNTGAPRGSDMRLRIATNTVHVGGTHSSNVQLTVLPG